MSNAWEILNPNRRSAPRHPARLPTSLSLAAQENGFGHIDRPPVIPGRTRDISLNGLALIVPSLRSSNHDLTELQHTWRVVLATLVGHVQVQARLVRYERFNGDGQQAGYLIGMQIEEMSEEDRLLFENYLRTLEGASPNSN